MIASKSRYWWVKKNKKVSKVGKTFNIANNNFHKKAKNKRSIIKR